VRAYDQSFFAGEKTMRSTPFILIGIFVSAIYASAAVAQMSKGDQVGKGAKATSQRSTRDSCPAGYPLACPGTDNCCPSDLPNLCKSLTQAHPQGLAPAGWSGCVRPGTNESWKFWSDSCQPVWERCN
jgi:hypothetical protein